MDTDLYQYLKAFMIESNWEDEYTRNDALAIFTTICLYFNIDADTPVCGEMLCDLYDAANMEEVEVSYDEFKNFMLTFII